MKTIIRPDYGDLTLEQISAMRKSPSCVDIDILDSDGTWKHLVFRVEHPVCLRSEGEDTYTRSEALQCQRWLKKYAPESKYCRVKI